MLKVVKFGGSSLADAEHFRKVRQIIEEDPARRYVVPSAPGKRFSADEKVTDLLYQCYYNKNDRQLFDETFQKIIDRRSKMISAWIPASGRRSRRSGTRCCFRVLRIMRQAAASI